MAANKRLTKPDFGTQLSNAVWISDDYLRDAVKRRLRECLPGHYSDDLQDKVLSEVSHAVQIAGIFFESEAPAQRRRKFEVLQRNARELLKAIKAIGASEALTLHARVSELSFDLVPGYAVSEWTSSKNVHISERLESWWDIIQDVEVIAELASADEEPSRSSRLTKSNAKRLVYQTAAGIHRATGSLPPHSKQTWFPDFMGVLGHALKVECNGTTIEAVLKEMKRGWLFPTQEPSPPPV